MLLPVIIVAVSTLFNVASHSRGIGGSSTISSLVGLCSSSCCRQGKGKSHQSCRYLTAAPLEFEIYTFFVNGSWVAVTSSTKSLSQLSNHIVMFLWLVQQILLSLTFLLLTPLSWLMSTWEHNVGGAVPGKDSFLHQSHKPPSQCVHKVS